MFDAYHSPAGYQPAGRTSTRRTALKSATREAGSISSMVLGLAIMAALFEQGGRLCTHQYNAFVLPHQAG